MFLNITSNIDHPISINGYNKPGNAVTSCKEVVRIDDCGSAKIVSLLLETHHPGPLGLCFELII
ncbi:hypothetical protein E2C01_014030 [Portunus trituberculatus]|uniref:Uncharacterized protein n=1 Tax=Portunus trituberculatus TaxID=210409 RepID=A0A5B7DIN6_PORTR|nr:hypothetical protein [Portunus trituberculatus]